MTGILAIAAGLLAVAYSMWPSLRARGRAARPGDTALPGEPADGGRDSAAAEAAVLRAWSVAAGELPSGALTPEAYSECRGGEA